MAITVLQLITRARDQEMEGTFEKLVPSQCIQKNTKSVIRNHETGYREV